MRLGRGPYPRPMDSRAGGAVRAPAEIDACGVRMVHRGKLAAVRAAMPAREQVEDLAEVFAPLGAPRRLRLP